MARRMAATSILLSCGAGLAFTLGACRSSNPPLVGDELAKALVVDPASAEDLPPREWLLKRVTLKEAWEIAGEGEPMSVLDEEGRACWKSFTDQVRAGDEVWYFRSPQESWEMRGGRGGLAVVRRGRIVYAIVTQMN